MDSTISPVADPVKLNPLHHIMMRRRVLPSVPRAARAIIDRIEIETIALVQQRTELTAQPAHFLRFQPQLEDRLLHSFTEAVEEPLHLPASGVAGYVIGGNVQTHASPPVWWGAPLASLVGCRKGSKAADRSRRVRRRDLAECENKDRYVCGGQSVFAAHPLVSPWRMSVTRVRITEGETFRPYVPASDRWN